MRRLFALGLVLALVGPTTPAAWQTTQSSLWITVTSNRDGGFGAVPVSGTEMHIGAPSAGVAGQLPQPGSLPDLMFGIRAWKEGSNARVVVYAVLLDKRAPEGRTETPISTFVIASGQKVEVPEAEQRPNFAGKWALVPEPGALLAPDDGGLTITQDATTLTVEQIGGSRTRVPIKTIYKLDGTETKQTINRADITTKATWDGAKLVTTVSGPSANWKDTWSLEDGRLIIVTTMPERTLTITRTYKKA